MYEKREEGRTSDMSKGNLTDRERAVTKFLNRNNHISLPKKIIEKNTLIGSDRKMG